jgi:pimeloyl-ACP methyl ester carboxylesterase
MEPAFYAAVPPSSRSPGSVTMIESVGPLFLAGRLDEAVTQFWSVLHPELSPQALAERVAGFLSPKQRPRWASMATEQPLVSSWTPMPAEWARIAQPARVIEGDRTGEVLRSIAAQVAEFLPHGELVTLKGFDHMAPWNAPEIVAQKVIEFIDRVGALDSKDSGGKLASGGPPDDLSVGLRNSAP